MPHDVQEFFEAQAAYRERFVRRNRYYYRDLIRLLKFLIPEDASVIELGCGLGTAIKNLPQKKKVGIDFSEKMIKKASESDSSTTYMVDNIEDLKHGESYDYVLMLDTINSLHDVQKSLQDIRVKLCHQRTRLVITYYNYLWEPILKLGELLCIKTPMPRQSWFSRSDVHGLLEVAHFEVVTEGQRLLFPRFIPILSWFFNVVIGKLPLIRRLCLVQYAVVRPVPYARKEYSVSIVMACRNEAGNIERALQTIPHFGSAQEIIFVEGGSSDDTWDVINEMKEKYKNKRDVQAMKQEGKGLAAAYHTALPRAKHDIIMILNGDLTVDPSELPKFYEAFALGTGDFINGSRLVYPMEKDAMQFFNLLANISFGKIFTWLTGQRIKDTLCGTKVFLAADFPHIMKKRKYFGEIDPFGDFELLLGSALLNRKIVEIPVRYRARKYGATNITRWSNGVPLLKMVLRGARTMCFW